MDCCLNPYYTGELANHCSPLKLYEYLAAGKPVISTEMPEARKFEDLLRIARSYEEFVSCCDEVIRALPEPEQKVRSRTSAALKYSWTNRFAAVNELVERTLY
jgi:hypothetical protein